MPPCPICGSEKTGRYVQQQYVKKHYIVLQSLKNGEIVKLKKKLPYKNAFCIDCNFEWREQPRLVLIDDDDKEMEKARRKTENMLTEYIRDNNIDMDKKPILNGMFSGLTDFF